jgi:hypothetical protein
VRDDVTDCSAHQIPDDVFAHTLAKQIPDHVWSNDVPDYVCPDKVSKSNTKYIANAQSYI